MDEQSLRVSVELLDVVSGEAIWGDRYEAKPSELLSVQRRITADVMRELGVKAGAEALSRSARNYTEDGEAYRLYLMGRYFFNKRTKEDFHKGIEYFRLAVEKDPSYALAYAGMADCYGLLGAYMVMETHAAFTSAREAANKALERDPISAPVYADYGRVLYWARRYEEALEKYRKASEMSASFGAMTLERNQLYEQVGRLDDWVDSLEKGGGFDAETREAFRADGLRGYWRVLYRRMLKHGEGGSDRAELFARYGDKERALADLTFAIEKRDHRMTQLKVNPVYDPLRSEPRFLELLRRMKLAP